MQSVWYAFTARPGMGMRNSDYETFQTEVTTDMKRELTIIGIDLTLFFVLRFNSEGARGLERWVP